MGKYTIEDLMDRSSEIDRVCAIVGNLSENEHTCIAIEGNWGCGKTHVMNIIQGEFEKDSNNIVIKYDAWENSYYDDPLITILYCILDKLKVETTNDKALKKIVKATLKEAKKDWDSAKGNILQKIAEAGKDSANFKIALACCLIEKIISIGKTATTSLLDNAKFSDFKSYQSLLSDTKDFLNALTAKSKDGTKVDRKKIILLVDEVDRCLPNQQLIILERLHHLLQVNNSAVIVALNKDVVAQTYVNRYCVGQSSLGNDYLKKFFDFEIGLSDEEYTMFKNHLQNYLYENIVRNEEHAKVLVSDIDFLIAKIVSSSVSKVKLDARQIRDYLNLLEKILNDRNEKLAITYLEFWLTVMLLYIKKFNPSHFNYNEYKTGKREASHAFFDLNNMLSANLEINSRTNYPISPGSFYYNHYINGNYNIYQYLLNYCLFRNGDGSRLSQLKSIAQRKDDYHWIDSVFESIDRHYVG